MACENFQFQFRKEEINEPDCQFLADLKKKKGFQKPS